MKRPCSGEYCFLSPPSISRCSAFIGTHAGLSCASAGRTTFDAAREAMANVSPDAAGGAVVGPVCAALAAPCAGAATSTGTVVACVGWAPANSRAAPKIGRSHSLIRSPRWLVSERLPDVRSRALCPPKTRIRRKISRFSFRSDSSGLARKFNREQTFAGTGEKRVVKVLSGTGRD